MTTERNTHFATLLGALTFVLLASMVGQAGANSRLRVSDYTYNLLVEAEVTGNLESYQKGLRGAVDHIIYDTQTEAFVKPSPWHEYGVGLGRDFGVVSEAAPAWWMAEWQKPVKANTIVLTGAYANQPQPETCWKIELRQDGQWTTHAQGKGGWYNGGLYRWGTPGAEPIVFDGLRVSVFSKDDKTSLKSIHFHGEIGTSWVVAYCPGIDAELQLPRWPVRVGQPAQFEAVPLIGQITSWKWDFGDGTTAAGQEVEHTFARSGPHRVELELTDGKEVARFGRTINVAPPVEARITPLAATVMVDKPVEFVAEGSVGKIKDYLWEFGPGQTMSGKRIQHIFCEPGIYQVKLTVSDGAESDTCSAIVRVHTEKTRRLPQVLLDTDAKNEVDDQHYISYALFSELDVLGINSIHHGGGQEPTNYAEILNIIDLASKSGLPQNRKPFVFRGADRRLRVPQSGKWSDTAPNVTRASEAILVVARGASPDNPVCVLPVGPCTNVASAVLQAWAEGLDLNGRIRVIALVGGPDSASDGTFNGHNDPWSVYVMCKSGVEFWTILESPTGASLRFDKRKEGDLYPKNPLGDYLKMITPAHNKALFDVTTVSMVIAEHQKFNWLTEVEPANVLGPDQGYRWEKAKEPSSVHIVRDIDEEAMKVNFFNTINGRPTALSP